MQNENTIMNYGVEISLDTQDKFLLVRETLTRIGIASKKEKKLYQSCHILHKQGKYYIVHFKEMFALDGKPSDFSDNDVARRNTIANLMHDWGLVEIIGEKIKDPVVSISQLKIISHKEKKDWELVEKYNIGKKSIKIV